MSLGNLQGKSPFNPIPFSKVAAAIKLSSTIVFDTCITKGSTNSFDASQCPHKTAGKSKGITGFKHRFIYNNKDI